MHSRPCRRVLTHILLHRIGQSVKKRMLKLLNLVQSAIQIGGVLFIVQHNHNLWLGVIRSVQHFRDTTTIVLQTSALQHQLHVSIAQRADAVSLIHNRTETHILLDIFNVRLSARREIITGDRLIPEWIEHARYILQTSLIRIHDAIRVQFRVIASDKLCALINRTNLHSIINKSQVRVQPIKQTIRLPVSCPECLLYFIHQITGNQHVVDHIIAADIGYQRQRLQCKIMHQQRNILCLARR
mmetsp:Transcript_53002/g.87811  ORF Transcript_53002/g.87811 Transcript_53002/m.87811 type:complete len:242 (-) Transcript_53002:121-846(-)